MGLQAKRRLYVAPMRVAVTRGAKRDQVAERVGFGVPFDPELAEGANVVHAEPRPSFVGGRRAADPAGLIARSGGTLCGGPGGAVVVDAPTPPVRVLRARPFAYLIRIRAALTTERLDREAGRHNEGLTAEAARFCDLFPSSPVAFAIEGLPEPLDLARAATEAPEPLRGDVLRDLEAAAAFFAGSGDLTPPFWTSCRRRMARVAADAPLLVHPFQFAALRTRGLGVLSAAGTRRLRERSTRAGARLASLELHAPKYSSCPS